MIPWLAESWEYNDDLTELRIVTRSGITWSDGEPFSAEDVAFTLNAVRDAGSKVRWGVDVEQFVEEATAESDTETLVKFKVPAPRFFYFMTYKYDIGLYIVPKHIFEGEDLASFKAFDIANGLPVTTGPWRLVFSSPEQKVIDRADSWWAVDQGLVDALPGVERIIYLPWTEETQMAQQLISNEIDCSLDLRPLTMETILVQNPAIITHTFSDPPYGYVDWWPTSLYVNNEREPFNDPDVRWALSSFIDRDQVIEVALAGAGSTWPLPLPSYPGLQPFVETISDLLEEYPTLEFNPEKGAALLEGKGWAKNADGIWAKDGTTLDVDIISFAVMADIGPVIAEQLRQQGVNASFAMPPDAITRFQQGDYNASLFGHGGSVSADPYFTLRLYQIGDRSGARRPPGQLLQVAQRRVRQDRRRDGHHAAGGPGGVDGAVAAGDGDLAAGAARHPDSGVVPPHPDEHDLLAGLADQGRSLRQWRLLAPDVPARPQPVDADAVTRLVGDG